MKIIENPEEITPVEFCSGLYIKREDLYRPFGENSVNGGKLRQCYNLVKKSASGYPGVISCCSIHSPQGPITAAVANSLGKKAVICYGSTNYSRLDVLEMPQIAKAYGADLRIISKSGIHRILYNKARTIAKNENLFVVDFGFNIIQYPEIMYSAVSNQVQNLPDYLDNLVVTCGSGITSIGVFLGLKKFNKKVAHIYLVATAPDRRKLINESLLAAGIFPRYEYVDLFHSTNFRYEKGFYEEVAGIKLHPNYEAKTYNWLKNNLDFQKEKTLLWNTGVKPLLERETILWKRRN